MKSDKITSRQFFIIYFLTTLSPAIRLFPSLCARYGKTAGWLAPLIGAVIPAAIIAIFTALQKGRGAGGFGEALDSVFGGTAAKALLLIYLIWTMLLFILYIRYYAERLVSALFTSAAPDFFIISMLVIVFFALRVKLSALARFSELSALIFAIVFIIFFISLLPTVKLGNVMPVTIFDLPPLLRSALPIAGIWCYVTPLFFLGGYIDTGKKHGRNTVILLAVTTALMVFAVVGSLGPDAAARMPLPFFKVSKLIDIIQSFDRFEALLASIWVIADFILITVFAFIILSILKKLFGISDPKYLAGPVVMFGYAGSLLIAADRFELEILSGSPLAHTINLILCLAVPAICLITARIRGR